MFKKLMYALPLMLPLAIGTAHANDALFSTHLHAKFQVKACTICHDFFEKDRNGLAFGSHADRRDVNACAYCHSPEVSGFAHARDWFAMPGLYLSGMDARATCEKTKDALHAKFKSDALIAAQFETHLFHDPRVLWGIEGATPNSGKLPFGKKEEDLVKGGFAEWKTQVMAWIKGGLKCE